MRKQLEFNLQKRVCAYLRVKYSDVLFMSDTIASVKLTNPQAVRNASIQKRGFKTPDLIIFAPRGKYNGLFIELKKDNPYKLNGQLRADLHLQQQSDTIEELNKIGYYADFKWDFDEVVKLLDWYLNLNPNES